jgi:hypothetical protein
MAEETLRISAPISIVPEVLQLARMEGATVSDPQPASSTADPLNAPITGGDIQAAAEVVTVVFAAGSAAVKFLGSVLDLAKKHKARIKVASHRKKKGVTLKDEKDIKELLGKDRNPK